MHIVDAVVHQKADHVRREAQLAVDAVEDLHVPAAEHPAQLPGGVVQEGGEFPVPRSRPADLLRRGLRQPPLRGLRGDPGPLPPDEPLLPQKVQQGGDGGGKAQLPLRLLPVAAAAVLQDPEVKEGRVPVPQRQQAVRILHLGYQCKYTYNRQ